MSPCRLRIAHREEKEIRQQRHRPAEMGRPWRPDACKARRSYRADRKQRVAIARAVISHPRLLLADEPTGNLDDQIGMRLMHLFDELHRMGTTLVVATHNQGLVDQFGHPQLHLNNGTVEVIRWQ
jgi:cell division transport system ATP-binding protein